MRQTVVLFQLVAPAKAGDSYAYDSCVSWGLSLAFLGVPWGGLGLFWVRPPWVSSTGAWGLLMVAFWNEIVSSFPAKAVGCLHGEDRPGGVPQLPALIEQFVSS